jgi:2'-5' RNA ligase
VKELNVSEIYDSMWRNTIGGFNKNQFEYDYFLNHRDDDFRRGISVIGRLNGGALTKILDFLDEGQTLEPNQHFYSQEDIHLTILSIISCTDTFDGKRIHYEDYMKVIAASVESLKSVKIAFRGITASPSCVMIQGFPLDDNLAILRNQLRNSFRATNLEHSMDKRYTLKTAHSTVIRFKNPLHNHKGFIDFLNRYRDYDFGCVEMSSIDFVYNDWYMTNSIVKTLNTYKLAGCKFEQWLAN